MKRPRVLLIGAGRFGLNHLRVLLNLQKRGRIQLAGAVVQSYTTKRSLQKTLRIPVYVGLSEKLLKNIDAVDIVTPYRTHAQIVRKCLPYAHVFVEKPLAASAEDARELARLARYHKRTLFVGHIYRFHPLIEVLKKSLSNTKKLRITGTFTNPLSTYRGEDPVLENVHPIDVLDFLFGAPIAHWRSGGKYLARVDLRYNMGDASLKLGWEGEKKIRTIEFKSSTETILADFQAGIITIKKGAKRTIHGISKTTEPLLSELEAWCDVLSGSVRKYPDGQFGARMVALSQKTLPQRPRVAVIGGGIFGMSAALSLPGNCDVHVYEQNTDILKGATDANQFRHHMGYHYPRSVETIREIQGASKDFERWFKQSLIRDFPSYYCIARSGSHVSAARFKAICRSSGLPCPEVAPIDSLINPEEVSGCFRTREGVYDSEKVRAILTRKLRKTKHVQLFLRHTVRAASFSKDGHKTLSVRNRHGRAIKAQYDFVINATYANYNMLPKWLQFERRPMELRYKEIILIRLRHMKRFAVTIMDGPFATIVPTKNPEIFTFGDVPLSVRDTVRGDNGTLPYLDGWKKKKSLWKIMQERSSKWLPILKKAEYVRSFFTVLPVDPSSLEDDSRRSIVTDHGFGCYSILSGKVITAVSAAKDVTRRITSPSI